MTNQDDYTQKLETTRDLWNKEAENFDQEADHSLSNPLVREAWKTLLKESIKASAKKVLDIGCGTGSLSLLLANLGYEVIGADLSPAMIQRAKTKTQNAGYDIAYHIMDASYPEFAENSFDVIICRHLLWALPDPHAVLRRWQKLLTTHGQLLLIEGYWHTGGGLHADEIIAMIPSDMQTTVKNLSSQSVLWDKDVTDERYLISANFSSLLD